jgi:hypothetical protein
LHQEYTNALLINKLDLVPLVAAMLQGSIKSPIYSKWSSYCEDLCTKSIYIPIRLDLIFKTANKLTKMYSIGPNFGWYGGLGMMWKVQLPWWPSTVW